MPTSSEQIHTSAAPLLRMSGVRKRFGPTLALDGVELCVDRGEVLALVGENGAGKSTLMKVLSGAHPPDEGQMWLDSVPYEPRNPLEARRAGVAMIYQELSLAPHLSVAENILLGMEPSRGPFLDRKTLFRRAADALEQVGRPDIPLDAPVGLLSVAERQLVEIGRAVAVGNRLLVLDEPTSSLTIDDSQRLFDLVNRLKNQGHAIIYISHFLEEVQQVSDRYLVLRDGRSVGGGSTADADQDHIIRLMVGRTVDELYPRSSRNPGERVLQIRNLTGQLRPISASLDLHRGEVLGIAGLVGAGRTEFLRVLFGLDPVRRGDVKIATCVSANAADTPTDRWRQGLGMVSEDRKSEGLALNLSLTDNLTLTRLPGLLRPADLDREADRWRRRLDIRCGSVGQSAGSLSGGNQQKLALGRLLYHDADILLLDEPTRGIDVGSKALLYSVIDELASQGKAVLMVSSYIPELLGICDRIAVMCRGVLGPARSVKEMDEHRIMLEATGTEIEHQEDIG